MKKLAYILICTALVIGAAFFLPGFDGDPMTRFARYAALGPLAVVLAILILR